MYDPMVGRFLEEDPIEFAGGDPNLFRYVGNQATTRTDPSGLQSEVAPVPHRLDKAAQLAAKYGLKPGEVVQAPDRPKAFYSYDGSRFTITEPNGNSIVIDKDGNQTVHSWLNPPAKQPPKQPPAAPPAVQPAEPLNAEKAIHVSTPELLTEGKIRELDQPFEITPPFDNLARHLRNVFLTGDKERAQFLKTYKFDITPFNSLGLHTWTHKEIKNGDLCVAEANTVKIAANFFVVRWWMHDPDSRLGLRFTENFRQYVQLPDVRDELELEPTQGLTETPPNGNAWRAAPLAAQVAKQSGYTHGILWADAPSIIVFMKDALLPDGQGWKPVSRAGQRKVGSQKIQLFDKKNPLEIYSTVYLQWELSVNLDGVVNATVLLVNKESYDIFLDKGPQKMSPPRDPFAPPPPPMREP